MFRVRHCRVTSLAADAACRSTHQSRTAGRNQLSPGLQSWVGRNRNAEPASAGGTALLSRRLRAAAVLALSNWRRPDPSLCNFLCDRPEGSVESSESAGTNDFTSGRNIQINDILGSNTPIAAADRRFANDSEEHVHIRRLLSSNSDLQKNLRAVFLDPEIRLCRENDSAHLVRDTMIRQNPESSFSINLLIRAESCDVLVELCLLPLLIADVRPSCAIQLARPKLRRDRCHIREISV